jgi:hypothetical protein
MVHVDIIVLDSSLTPHLRVRLSLFLTSDDRRSSSYLPATYFNVTGRYNTGLITSTALYNCWFCLALYKLTISYSLIASKYCTDGIHD